MFYRFWPISKHLTWNALQQWYTAKNYCCKALHLRCLQESWILLWTSTWSRKFSTSKDFSTIKNVFQNQIFFLYQRSFPQAEIFLWSRKFYTCRDFFMIKEVFLDQETFPLAKIFFDQGISPQGKIFPLSGKFSRSKDFFLIRSFQKENIFPQSSKFSISKDFFFISEFFTEDFYIHTILKILGKNILTF